MGTFIGHVVPGSGFLLIGLWHLFSTIRNYTQSPWDFHTRPWFPARFGRGKLKYMELVAIIAGSCLSILAELFIGPRRHQPLADDWSIPQEHLNNFEHSSISLFFLIYASVALYAEVRQLTVPPGALHVIAALAFSQELLLFHLHSADHMGAEGHYHWLLQLIIAVSLSRNEACALGAGHCAPARSWCWLALRAAEDSGPYMQTILLVDNDPLQAFFRKSLLERRFRNVMRVGDAAEALCLVEQAAFALSLGLVICQPNMPGIGGPEFVAELHERLPHVPVLVLCGWADEANRNFHGGYVRSLPRPYKNDELLDVVEEMLTQDLPSEYLFRDRRAS